MSFIEVDQQKCNQDSICVAECPARVLLLDPETGYPIPIPDFNDYCLRCGHCVCVCPTGALSLNWLRPEDCTAINNDLFVTPKQAEQLLCGRRSIRVFKEKEVPRNILEKLLEIACCAPSAKNQQPWHWVVVQEPYELRRLAGMVIDWMRVIIHKNPEAAEMVGFTRSVISWDKGEESICRAAPHIIIAHAHKDWGFGCEDCTLALSLLDLYATSLGLGTCWGGYFYKAINAYKPLFEALNLPGDHLAFGAIMIGYPTFEYYRIPVRKKPRVTWK
jgi:nitroreductase/NAD-dependent dihydropyrimidine dehydrogenase PreA subunit